jgi:SNF2 family DNA or RNA helicase
MDFPSEYYRRLTIAAVFVQWIPMLSILGRMVFQKGINFVYFWGGMDSSQQQMCIKAFQENPRIKIMVSPYRSRVPMKASLPSRIGSH